MKKPVTLILALVLLTSIIPSSSALTFDLDSQVNLSQNSGDSLESQIAVSDSNVFVVWKDNTSGSNNILFKKSNDNGTTYGSTITLDSGTLNSQKPQVTTSGTNVYAVWQEDINPSFIAFAKSSDSGDSFGAQVILSSSTSTISPQIAASSGDDVYVTGQNVTRIFFSDSDDSGSTFDSPISLSSDSSSDPKLAISASNVYVVWRQGSDISFVRSTDTAENFDPKKNLSNTSETSRTPDLVALGSNVYVVWVEGTDIFFTKSTDNGASFSTPIDIGDTGGESSPSPKISADGTHVYIVWSEKNGGSSDISFARSTNSGDSFESKINLSSNSGRSSTPQITSEGGKIAVAWKDNTTGNDEILLRSSDNNGTSFGPSTNISDNDGISLEPRILLSGERLFAIWEDTEPDMGGFDRDILFVTGTPSSISVSFNKSEYTLNESAQITVSDPSSSGSIDVTVTSTSDSTGLVLSLAETGVGTGVFTGSVSFDTQTHDSSIHAKAGDTINASFGGQSSSVIISPITVEVQKSGISFAEFDYGDIVNVKVTDKNSNQDSGVSETITVKVTSTRDIQGISLELTETGPNTGVFGGTSSSLIFTDGDDSVKTGGTITLSMNDPSADTDPNNPDTLTITVKSTTDTTGISLTLTETGPSTQIFTKQISLSSTSSVSETTLQVSPGDIISVIGGFTTNALVIPNPNASTGAISVDFATADTVTISYLGKSSVITVKNSLGGGGGGGGLVRPSLVVNVLAGLSLFGGSGSSSPVVALGGLVSNPNIEMPDEIKFIVENQDPAIPMSVIDPQQFPDFDLPLTINKNGFALGKFSNTIETQVVETNKPVTIRFVLYESSEISHISLYANLRDSKTEIHQSDTQIIFDEGNLKLVDKNGFLKDDDVSVQISDIDEFKKEALFVITFVKPMDTSNIIFRTWDEDRNSFDTHVIDAINVVEPQTAEELEILKNPEPEIKELQSRTIPIWIKNNAGWWSEDLIDDYDFINGIQYLIENKIIILVSSSSTSQDDDTISPSKKMIIPGWIKNNAGWWSESLITDDDFVKGIQYLIENKIVEVT